jgi:succinoglycan biosynthesis protein ExoA
LFPVKAGKESELFVSIVMPSLNEEAFIGAALSTICNISERLDYEVLVMDGGSTDQARRIVMEAARLNKRIKIYDNPKRLQSAALNFAEMLADPRADIIIRADCHAAYPEGFVEICCRKLIETRACAVVVPLKIVGICCFQRAAAVLQTSVLGHGGGDNRPVKHSGFVDHGHHAAFDRRHFRVVKGYDETFSHNEDTELDIRIAAAGGAIWLEASIPVTYFPRFNMRSLMMQYLN